MGMRDDIMAVKRELSEVREESFAMEILKDYKKTNKRMFVIWIITFVSFLFLLGYTIYLLNDISTVEDLTQTIENVDSIDDSTISNG